jgi:hypothetical protein
MAVRIPRNSRYSGVSPRPYLLIVMESDIVGLLPSVIIKIGETRDIENLSSMCYQTGRRHQAPSIADKPT